MSKYRFGSIVDRDFRNTLQRLADDSAAQGKSIQDLVAEGQLTEEQYADLITIVNGMVKRGDVDHWDLTTNLRRAIGSIDDKISRGDVSVSDIDKNKGKFDQSYMSEDFLQQMAGNTPINTVPALKSITSAQLADKAVEPINLAFVEESKNLYNKNTSTQGQRIDLSGEIIESENHVVSDFIRITPNTTYYKNYTIRVNFYDESKERLRTVGYATTSPFTTDEEDLYVRVEISKNNSPIFMLNEGNDLLEYEPYGASIVSSDSYPLRLEGFNFGDANNDGYVYVDDFGDDEGAIQSAFDVANGNIVVLRAGAVYDITSGLSLDLSKVRGIQGNNAKLVVRNDITALTVNGGLGNGSANPNTVSQSLYDEMNFSIDRLRITCDKTYEEENDFIGTGIVFDGAFGINMYYSQLFKLKNGIVFKNRNRNHNFVGNHLYYCTDTAIVFEESSNHHQLNMNGNHISYFKKGIHFKPGSQTFNFQFNGNDIECSTTPQVVEHIILCENVLMLEGFQVLGNTIEDHGHCLNPLMVFDTTYRSLKQIHFIGNDMGNSVVGVFKFNAGDQIVIADNSCDGTLGMFADFDLTDNLTGTQIKGNTIRDVELFRVTTTTAGKYVENIDVSGNIVKNARSLPAMSLVGTDVRESRFDNNQVQVHSAHGDVTKPIFHVTGGTFRNSTIKGNNLWGTTKAKHGLLFDAQMHEAVFITENIGYQTVDEKFVLPAGSANKIIRDNV